MFKPSPAQDARLRPSRPRAFQGCTCECHSIDGPDILHFIPCCGPLPGEELRPRLQDEIDATVELLQKTHKQAPDEQ